VGIIVDEYGDIQGLVTVEDILEEIVGDFTTSMSPNLAEEVNLQSDGSVLIDGSASVRDLNKAFNWSLPIGSRTINGLLLEELGEIPPVNTELCIGSYQIAVMEVQENRIRQVRIKALS